MVHSGVGRLTRVRIDVSEPKSDDLSIHNGGPKILKTPGYSRYKEFIDHVSM